MREITSRTCIQFRPIRDDDSTENYLKITLFKNCQSEGRHGRQDKVPVSLELDVENDCMSDFGIRRRLMEVIGFYAELGN